MIVLDTDVLTLFQFGDPVVVRRVQAHPLPELAVTIISVEDGLVRPAATRPEAGPAGGGLPAADRCGSFLGASTS
jgi:hypothetical protein